jgi:ribonuclease R
MELGVHIADVGAFVKPAARSTTRRMSAATACTSRPRRPDAAGDPLERPVQPAEGQPRLVKSAFIRYDAKGRPPPRDSQRRHSIERNGSPTARRRDPGGQETGRFPREVAETLREAEKLAHAIRRRRLADGMLVLDLPRGRTHADEKGNVVGAEPADTGFSHTLIEMFMVEANEAVARLFARLGVPCLRGFIPNRRGSRRQLGQFLRFLGYKLPRVHSRKDLQALLDATRGKPEGFAVTWPSCDPWKRPSTRPGTSGTTPLPASTTATSPRRSAATPT